MHEDIRQAAARRITEEAAHWMLANREGLDEASRVAFMDWLRHSPAHVAEYLAITQWDQDMREAASRDPVETAALVGLAAADPAVVPLYPAGTHPVRGPVCGNATGRAASAQKMSRAGRAPTWVRWAGGAVAAVAVAALAVWHMQPTVVDGVVYNAPVGATRSLELDDGSRIQLDQGSAIRVSFNPTRRDITVLGGTMLIDVGHRSDAPLSVTLGRTILRDIGTVFQVSAKSDGGDVTVLSGRVDVLAPQAGWPWQPRASQTQNVLAHLEGGQRATLARDGSLTHLAARTDLAQDLAWLPDDIDFHNAAVADVARRFNDYGQAPLLIEDSIVASTRISGRFHARDPAGFVAYLQTLPDVKVHRDASGVHVVRVASGTHGGRL